MPETFWLLERVLIDSIIYWKPAIKILIIFSVPLYQLDSIIRNAHLWTDFVQQQQQHTKKSHEQILYRERQLHRYTRQLLSDSKQFSPELNRAILRSPFYRCNVITSALMSMLKTSFKQVYYGIFANVLVSISHHLISHLITWSQMVLFANISSIEIRVTSRQMYAYPPCSAHTESVLHVLHHVLWWWCDVVCMICFVSALYR